MTDDQQLCLLTKLGDEPQEPVQVHVVKRGLNFVHDVERRRSTAEDREQERECSERAFTTRKQRQLLDVLAARLGFNFDAGVQEVVGHRQHEATVATREEGCKQLGEIVAHVGVGGSKHLLNLEIHLLDYLH